jgi:hypothetical protein
MPASRNLTYRSNSRSKDKRLSRNNDRSAQHCCFICTSPSQDSSLQTVILDSTTLSAHSSCVWAIPELDVIPSLSTANILVIQNRTNYQKRYSLVSTYSLSTQLLFDLVVQKCSVCKDDHGPKIQCVEDKCTRAFHINCASKSPDIQFELLGDPHVPYKLLCRMHNPVCHHRYIYPFSTHLLLPDKPSASNSSSSS